LDSISWAKGLDKDLVKSMAKLCTTKIYSTGQVIQKPGGASQGVSIVARGNVKIMDGKETIELAGKGAMIGQQSLLTSSPNKHGAIAESPVTVLWLSKSNVHRLMQESEQFGAILRRMD
jgi:CRP-like cAMP-binding protein